MKVQQNTWLSQAVREELSVAAEQQHLTPGKLGALLIAWGLRQMSLVGSIVALERMSVVPDLPKGIDSSAREQALIVADRLRGVSQGREEGKGERQANPDTSKKHSSRDAGRPGRRKNPRAASA